MEKLKRAVVVGAGLSGATCAAELACAGYEVQVLETRPHVAGNVFDHYDQHGFLVHKYGPHIFHTNSERIYHFLSKYTAWRPYEHRVLARVNGRDYPMPLNFTSLGKYFNKEIRTEAQAVQLLNKKKKTFESVQNAEEYLLSTVGPELTNAFFAGYSKKQWGCDLCDLDASIVARVPVRLSQDDRYFQDVYQGIPSEGYTTMVARMLDHPSIRVQLNYRASLADLIGFDVAIYTGAVDQLLDYCHGRLPYRSLQFEFEHLAACDRLQETGTVNYPDIEDGPFTRITEFKHLTGQTGVGTSIVREFPAADGDPYYPVPSEANRRLHQHYVSQVSKAAPGVIMVGRLAEYRYYNMDQAVASALAVTKRIIHGAAS